MKSREITQKKDREIFPRRKNEITQALENSAQLWLEKANTSNDLSESHQCLDIYNRIWFLARNPSRDEDLLDKVKHTSTPEEACKWLTLWERKKKTEEQLRKADFVRFMTSLFFFTGVAGIGTGVGLGIPVLFGVGEFVLGASVFSIVPDYVSKFKDKFFGQNKNIRDDSQQIPSNENDNLNIGDTDKHEDS